MRLSRMYINGFGSFHDLRIEGLSPGLTIILGQNESGKTTLLSFIRSILFGFPDGRSNENLYPPLAGGKHGGNVTLVSVDGESYLIERYPGPRGGAVDVLKPDQTHGGKDLLGRLLGTANRVLYRNVYAFSLSELQDFETLNAESVRETLYSAGAGLDPHDLSRLKGELERRANDLFKAGGSKPKINLLLARLGAIRQDKRHLRGAVDQYDRLQTRIREISGEVLKARERRLVIETGSKRVDRGLRAWPDWIDLQLVEEKLERIDPIEDFPPQALSRLDHLKDRLVDAEKSLLEKEEDLDRLEKERSGLKTAPRLMALENEIREIQRGQGRFDALREEIHSLDQEIVEREQRIKEELSRLGAEWNDERVADFDLSLALREEVRSRKEELARSEKELQRKRIAHDGILVRRREAEEVLFGLQGPETKDPKELEKKKEACRRLLDLHARRRLMDRDLAHLEERLGDLERERKSLEGAAEKRERPRPLWPVPVLLGTGAASGVWVGLRGEAYSAMLAGVLVLFGFFYWVLKRESGRRAFERAAEIEGRLEDLNTRFNGLHERRSGVEREFDALREGMERAARDLGRPEAPPVEVLIRLDRELADQQEALKAWVRARDEVERVSERENASRKEMETAESRYEEITRRWRSWLEARGLDPVLSPDGALETFGVIRALREQIRDLDRLREKRAALEAAKTGYLALIDDVLTRSGMGPDMKKDIQLTLREIIGRFQESEQAEQKRLLFNQEISLCRESMDRLKAHMAGFREEIRALLASGGEDQEDDFRKKALIFERREGLKKERETLTDNLKRLAGPSGALEELKRELSGALLEELEQERRELEQESNALEEILDHLRREQATLEEQARQLIQDERMSKLRAEEEDLRETLSALADEWAVLKLAQGLIRMAGERYEKERQPSVINEAGRFFSAMTLGTYSSVLAPFGENRIEVVRDNGARREIGQLSRGTAEQLYLALRFGFVREFSRRSEPLPIIMDDILVNFDPIRAHAAVKALLELSRDHQILFFTCHPQTAELFREAEPGVPILEIKGGRVIG